MYPYQRAELSISPSMSPSQEAVSLLFSKMDNPKSLPALNRKGKMYLISDYGGCQSSGKKSVLVLVHMFLVLSNRKNFRKKLLIWEKAKKDLNFWKQGNISL